MAALQTLGQKLEEAIDVEISEDVIDRPCAASMILRQTMYQTAVRQDPQL